MSHSYSSNRIHVIFSTKERHKNISDEQQPTLWAYMAGIARNQGFEAMIIGGVKDHVHALLLLPPSLPFESNSISERKFVEVVKRNWRSRQ